MLLVCIIEILKTMPSILTKLTLLVAILFCSTVANAQNAPLDSITIENLISTAIKANEIETIKLFKKEIKAHDIEINKIRSLGELAGNQLVEAAMLQNQSRVILILGSAIGGLVLFETGSITTFSVIVGGASLISLYKSIKSSAMLKKAGLTLIELNYN
jgi:hypothetical protein